MNKIHVLPEDVSRKIAAGEVIERPVSVVKELVENSLDAGASAVRIELAEGGRRLIKVADDGSGMSREDAALCFRRHSTSKIASEADLERISTLGFRGEALASIAAVSRLTLRTFDGTGERGTVIEREGDRLVAVTDIAFPRGTAVEVRDLFFNLPARRKFLRSAQSELNVIAKYVTQAALASPGARFTLVHGARQVIDCPAVGTLRERVFQLFGKALVDRLMDVAAVDGGSRVEGLASLPLAGRGDRSVQHVFVNGRPVKDRVLSAALNQAYAGILEKGRQPEAFLFIGLPLEDVDVNVHPAKAEVRFKDSQVVFRTVLRAVSEGAARGHTIKEVYPVSEEGRSGRGVSERGGPAGAPGLGLDRAPDREAGRASPWAPADTGTAAAPGAGGDMYRRYVSPSSAAASVPAGEDPVVLGQYENMYIVAGSEEGLLVIDQHNAHERVLFEKYKEIDRQQAWPRQSLLIPALAELSPSQRVSFEENAALLEELGFRAEAMGGRSVALKEYPDIFGREAALEVFLGLIEEAGGAEAGERRDRMLATMACKSAVKAGQPLTREKMGYLVAELFKISRLGLCPHGRPVVVRIDRAQIDKGLKR
ncbi:MAG: DNA mismatch repair endonuclease MutL [Candidatus Aminicenantes bacterium]|nr:DNA mismatch repair endonuclease MutL [Candidatus Aminicenantes bacterium]